MKNCLKVLVADDSGLMRMVIKGVLKKLMPGIQFFESTNLIDTFEIIAAEEIEFLLLDINMPKGDSSPNTVREILAVRPDIKICMFTGNDRKTLEKQYTDAGAIGFVQKDEHMSVSVEEVLKDAFR